MPLNLRGRSFIKLLEFTPQEIGISFNWQPASRWPRQVDKNGQCLKAKTSR